MKALEISVLFLLCVCLLTLGCGGETQRESGQQKIKVGLVFDIGGKGDKSFNDAAYRGVTMAARDFPIDFVEFEPGQDADREVGLRKLAREGYDLIIGVGFLFTDAITTVAEDFPQVKFACVDYDLTESSQIPPNLAALKFREEEGSFLVGALAAMKTAAKIVGFVGGMDIPLIHKFEAGYEAGVHHVDPSVKILVNYAGSTGKAFADPARGKELALSQYNKGADIIFQAAGTTGLGVKEAALEKGKLVIWVDSVPFERDKEGKMRFLAPGTILTTMIKRVDVAVYNVIKGIVQGNFPGGVMVFGLAEDGVDWQDNEHNHDLISATMRERIETMRQMIIDGEIVVPRE